MDTKLPKQERISKRTDIERLFTHGEAFLAYPVKATFRIRGDKDEGKDRRDNLTGSNRVMVMVSKRNLKRAVGRNRIKRLLREVYRLNKQLLPAEAGYDIALSYIAKDNVLPAYQVIEKAVVQLLKRLNSLYASPLCESSGK